MIFGTVGTQRVRTFMDNYANIILMYDRPQVLHDRIWIEASDYRMVGSFTAS